MQGRVREPRTDARVADDDAPDGADGLIARLAEGAIENPAMTGGLFVMALTATAIVSNAMFLQNARHPDPLFATRPPAITDAAVPAPVPLPRTRVADVPAPVAPAAPAVPQPMPPPVNLVGRIQQALAAKGLYSGTVDGVMGARTHAAIAAFEKSAGMRANGTPSQAVLDHLNGVPAKAPAPTPVAVKPPPAAATPAPAKPAPAVAPVVAPAPKPVAAAVPTPVAAPAQPDPAAADRQRYKDVQDALNRTGYGPLAIDGHDDEATSNAIRRFELDNGLPITGKPGDRVVARLKAIGAMGAK